MSTANLDTINNSSNITAAEMLSDVARGDVSTALYLVEAVVEGGRIDRIGSFTSWRQAITAKANYLTKNPDVLDTSVEIFCGLKAVESVSYQIGSRTLDATTTTLSNVVNGGVTTAPRRRGRPARNVTANSNATGEMHHTN